MADTLLYRGTPVFFNGKNYIVPSLSVAQFEDHYDALTKVSKIEDAKALKKHFATLIPIIGMALRRNYPDLRDEELRFQLDLGSFKECLQAVQSASGLKEAVPGEA